MAYGPEASIGLQCTFNDSFLINFDLKQLTKTVFICPLSYLLLIRSFWTRITAYGPVDASGPYAISRSSYLMNTCSKYHHDHMGQWINVYKNQIDVLKICKWSTCTLWSLRRPSLPPPSRLCYSNVASNELLRHSSFCHSRGYGSSSETIRHSRKNSQLIPTSSNIDGHCFTTFTTISIPFHPVLILYFEDLPRNLTSCASFGKQTIIKSNTVATWATRFLFFLMSYQ